MPIMFTHTWKELMDSNVAISPPKLALEDSLTYNKNGITCQDGCVICL